jgi:hypothetical protein
MKNPLNAPQSLLDQEKELLKAYFRLHAPIIYGVTLGQYLNNEDYAEDLQMPKSKTIEEYEALFDTLAEKAYQKELEFLDEDLLLQLGYKDYYQQCEPYCEMEDDLMEALFS